MRALVTIGVYGFTAERFLDALARASVGVLLDVRRRRGVRGSEIRVGELGATASRAMPTDIELK